MLKGKRGDFASRVAAQRRMPAAPAPLAPAEGDGGKCIMGTMTEQNVVTMICPNLGCGRTVSAPATARGQSVRCPHCNAAFRVPGGAVAPAAADPLQKQKRKA